LNLVRQISVRPHFSACGSYLHIASFEGEAFLSPKLDRSRRELGLSIFVATYRLSSSKPTRSPPRLLYKSKVALPGRFLGMSLTGLPVTFTWSPQHVYCSITGFKLNVYRISLFRSESQLPSVTVPRLVITLPLSATARQIHYLPPSGTRKKGMVLMSTNGNRSCKVQLRSCSSSSGSASAHRGMGDHPQKATRLPPSPPIGIYLDEEMDLGGWVAPVLMLDRESRRNSNLQKRGTQEGKLVRKVEYFNWEDDVDLEGVCDQCNKPLYITSARA
jgi:hypothetical protein